MKLDLKALKEAERTPHAFDTREAWDQLQHRGRLLDYTREVAFQGRAVYRNQAVHVTVQLQTGLNLECSRCLTPLPETVDLEEAFALYEEPEEGFIGVPIEGFGYPYGLEQLELRPYLERLIDASLATKPLCDPDCQGLCPDCGRDLNTEGCACDPSEPVDPRLAPLKRLLDG